MLKKLEEIAQKENINVSDEALKAISKQAEGGLRDALSLLDQCISFSKDSVSEDIVYQVSGGLSSTHIKAIFEAILDKNIEKCFRGYRSFI